MKAIELREKSLDELHVLQLELQEQQFKMRMKQASGQLSKTHELGQVRRNVARVKTIITEKRGNS